MDALLDDPSPAAHVDQVVAWATTQFRKRYERIERARGRTLAALEALPDESV